MHYCYYQITVIIRLKKMASWNKTLNQTICTLWSKSATSGRSLAFLNGPTRDKHYIYIVTLTYKRQILQKEEKKITYGWQEGLLDLGWWWSRVAESLSPEPLPSFNCCCFPRSLCVFPKAAEKRHSSSILIQPKLCPKTFSSHTGSLGNLDHTLVFQVVKHSQVVWALECEPSVR